MNIVEELEKLAKLRNQNLLSEEEFVAAKKKILAHDERNDAPMQETYVRPSLTEQNNTLGKFPFPTDTNDQTVGRAANRYVTLQGISLVVVLIVMGIFSISFCKRQKEFDLERNQRSKNHLEPSFELEQRFKAEQEMLEQLRRQLPEQKQYPSSAPTTE